MTAPQQIGCVLMASGFSRRFGENKLLAPFEGRPLAARALDIMAGAGFDRMIVVTRYPEVMALAEERGFPALCRPEDTLLPGGTIRVGLAAIREGLSGCCFLVGDQPLLRAESLRALIEAFRGAPESIWALSHKGKKGNPVLFPAAFFDALLALAPGETGRDLLRRYPGALRLLQVGDGRELLDIDTVSDLDRLHPHRR